MCMCKVREVLVHVCNASFCSFQQEHIISELKEYVAGSPTPLDASAVAMVVNYLEACNRLFERGILGHVQISTYPNQILNNMEDIRFSIGWIHY